MKTLMLVSVLFANPASASTYLEYLEYNEDALELLANITRHCSSELAQAMQSAERVGSGNFSAPRPSRGNSYTDTTTLELTSGHYPSPVVRVSTFTMTRHHVPAANGSSWKLGKVECVNTR